MIASAQHCSGGGLSYDDVDLFGRLRSLTIVRGLPLPDTVRAVTGRNAERMGVWGGGAVPLVPTTRGGAGAVPTTSAY